MSSSRRFEDDENILSNTPYSMNSNSNSSFVNNFCQSLIQTFKNSFTTISRNWRVLLFGQILSFCLATSGATSSELFLRCGLNAPTAQYSIMYLVLSFHIFPILTKNVNWKQYSCYSKNEEERRREIDEWNLEASPSEEEGKNNGNSQQKLDESANVPPYIIPILNVPINGPLRLYFLMAVMDVEANFFTILAFRYTSLTSITLLDALAIPGSMIASKFLLKCKYRPSHILGALICIAGTILNVISDYKEEEDEIEDGENVLYPNEIRGDLLAAIGGIMYGVNDAVAELLVKKYDPHEYIGFTVFFGFFFSVVQAFIVERDQIADFLNGSSSCHEFTIFGFLTLFLLANYISFTGISRFLMVSEAALLNLSLLTGISMQSCSRYLGNI